MTEAINKKNIIESVSAKYAQSNRDADSLRVRLETDDIKDKIREYLTGITYKHVHNPNTNRVEVQPFKLGNPKVNDAGFQEIMSQVDALVNRGTVMGNFKESSDLYDFLERNRKSFSMHLWRNMHSYGIKDSEFNGICGKIYALIEPFLTRTIGDGERGVIRDTTVHQDRVISGAPKVGLNPFNLWKK